MVSQWMRRTVLAGACASVALLAACGSSTIDSAISPTRLVAFGDAMSDTGQKGTAYTVNVTDGTLRNWTEQFGAQWGLSAKPASQGGYNFAQGNARIHLKPDAAGDAASRKASSAEILALASGDERSRSGAPVVVVAGLPW